MFQSGKKEKEKGHVKRMQSQQVLLMYNLILVFDQVQWFCFCIIETKVSGWDELSSCQTYGLYGSQPVCFGFTFGELLSGRYITRSPAVIN